MKDVETIIKDIAPDARVVKLKDTYIRDTIEDFEICLDGKFAGQEELKKILASVGHQYLMKQYAKTVLKSDLDLPSTVTMLIGGTGSGKTYCIEQFAQMMQLPFKRINANDITAYGWSGQDLYDILLGLPDQAILFIDEIDKLSNRVHSSGGGDVSANTQQVFLDILEGRPVRGEKSGAIRETKDLLIFLGGSFEESRRFENKNSLGFVEQTQEELTRDWKEFMQEAGILAELVGRINTVYEMKQLNDEELRQAVFGRSYTQYYNLFTLYHRNFVLGEEKIQEIIEATKTSKWGLREINNKISEYATEFLNKECKTVDIPQKIEDTKDSRKKFEGGTT